MGSGGSSEALVTSYITIWCKATEDGAICSEPA